jgi:hypothetical protein
MIALSAKGGETESLAELRLATIRSFQRPEAARFVQMILHDVTETLVPNTAGLLVPASVGNVDLRRFDRVITRIIKGLFFKERGLPLPTNYRVTSYSTVGLTKLPAAAGRKLQSLIEKLLISDPKHIGNTDFLYWGDFVWDDPNASAWLILIHRQHSFIGWTVKEDAGIP